MKSNQNKFQSEIIILQDEQWLSRQRIAGRVLASLLSMLEKFVVDGTTKSLLELDKISYEFIKDHNGCSPTFLNYKGFPNSVCMSVNQELVHGFAKPNQYLTEGDKISFDAGVSFESAIADSALTVFYSEPKKSEYKKLLLACEESLAQGIKAIKPGRHIGCIGYEINKCAEKYGFGNIINYGGHGIEYDKPHSNPFVQNKALQNNGIILQKGMTLALEPMFTISSTTTWVDKNDGWTVHCDAEMVSHFEHSIFIHSDYCEILTLRENENYLKTNKIYYEQTK